MTIYHPEVRLKKLLARAGGLTVDTAISRATANVAAKECDARDFVRKGISDLAELERAKESDRHDQMYRIANELFGAAGIHGWAELSEASHSLCEVLSLPSEQRRADIVDLHIRTLQALMRPELAGNEMARRAVLEGLRTIGRTPGTGLPSTPA